MNMSTVQPFNGSLESQADPESSANRVGKIVACVLVMVVALVGNILIIMVVRTNANMRKTINYFIVNMAVSDLAVPIVILPRVIVEIATDSGTWWAMKGVAGNILCKLMYVLSDMTVSVSILSLICIALDRFLAVVFPLKMSLMTNKARLALIAFTWLFSVAFYTPYFYGFELREMGGMGGSVTCSLSWANSQSLHFKINNALSIASSILFVLIPIVVLTTMYTVILVVARIAIVSNQENQANNAQSRRRQANNCKLLKLALLTVGAFAFCYGPYNVFLFYASFHLNWQSSNSDESFHVFLFVAQFLTFTNSALNPCLYFIFIENYKKGLKNLLKLKKRPENYGNILATKVTARSRIDGPNESVEDLVEDLIPGSVRR